MRKNRNSVVYKSRNKLSCEVIALKITSWKVWHEKRYRDFMNKHDETVNELTCWQIDRGASPSEYLRI